MANINFLHFSDLHLGDKFQSGLISQTKKILLEDIDFILSKINNLDVVFFTGDLVQKGTKEEFVKLEEFLGELWKLFDEHDHNPYLLCVPGNHDLERIEDLNDPRQIVMSNWTEGKIKDDYFWNPSNHYHDFIIERFRNFEEWYKNTSIRKPESICDGYIPGDFYCVLNLHDVNLGVVGLNSAFLQLSGEDAKKKLGVYNRQINLMFEENYFEWLKKQDFSILLTHHSPEWFEQTSFEEFNTEIYARDSYLEHICGHMHETVYTNSSINGFPSKRLFISPSLFGLENYGNRTGVKRIHGYTAGIYNIESGKISKTIWPRISIQTKFGIKISQNEEYNLDKSSSSFTETLKDSKMIPLNECLKDDYNTIENFRNEGENLFERKIFLDSVLVRTFYKEESSHKGIRFDERNRAVRNLKDKNYFWLVTSFGLCEDEFIGSILSEADINPENCFSLNCDGTSSLDELIEVFKSTFSKSITQFFDRINSLDRPLVIFNHLNSDLIEKTANLKEFIQTIFDFSPKSKMVFISESLPERGFLEYVQLFSLDIPAVKQFIESSQELHTSFTFLEYEKIHRLSSGIPFYINKVIEQLKFRPLSDLGDMEFANPNNDETNNILPKFLINEIKLLRYDDSKQGSRRFILLSVLSLLHNGETYDRIRRFDPNLPFHPEDISYLQKSKLVEIQHINSIFDDTHIDSDLIKIIRVPRVIRDYVSSLLSDEEKVEIYKQVCNLYLGKNWRNGIKFAPIKDAELSLIVHQNLQIALRFILLFGIESNNEVEAKRITRVSMSLINYFSEKGAYKDAVSMAEEILLLIKDVEFDDFQSTKTHLMKDLGENLRMTSIHNKSTSILKSICDDERNSLSNFDRTDIWLSLAYSCVTQNNMDEALKYANLIKQHEKNRESSIFLSADAIIANYLENDSEKLKKLNALKNKAEKFGFHVLKANIILNICKIVHDESQLKHLDKLIIESKDDPYNKVRALVVKSDIILKTKSIDQITDEDLLGLNISYSYSFYQRLLTLLNKCHWLVWQFWSKQNRFDQLLNLFRYSSFVWRLCGALDQEQKYVDELYLNPDFIEWFKSNKYGINSTYYEQRIFALYNNGKVIIN